MTVRRLFPFLSLSLVILLLADSGQARLNEDRQAALSRFEQVYHELLNRYVTDVDGDKLVRAGIEGMLDELDPYTQYIEQSNAHRIDALTDGEYGGVGIRLGRIGDTLVVISPMDGTPAERQGIQAGDIILAIDSVRTRELSLNEAANLVRGTPGTPVKLLIRRNGNGEPEEYDLVRELIKVQDVSYSGLIQSGVGYIKLANFSRNTSEQVEQAIRKLQQTQLDGLVLDLRGNPGGLLSSALRTADLFTPQGVLLLETRGRIKRANRRYMARRRPVLQSDIDLFVLVDYGSASAAEILAGILQDYDRAVLLGDETFGKGLVQTVFTLNPETRLKMTTAKYYLPSGRLIQRQDFGADVRLDDLLEPDSLSHYSARRRPVSGGGGISPDIAVEAYPQTVLEKDLWRRSCFFKFAVDHTAGRKDLTLPYHADDATISDMRTWLQEKELTPRTAMQRWLADLPQEELTFLGADDSLQWLTESLRRRVTDLWEFEFQREAHRIQRGIEMEVSRILGGQGARVAASLSGDPVINIAIHTLQTPGAVDAILGIPEAEISSQ